MLPFDFQPLTRFIFGVDSIDRLGELALGFSAKRVLIVSDPGVVRAGHFETGAARLRTAGLEIASFHEFAENPTTEMVDRGVAAAREFQPDLLVGLGGGSSIDCCKGINFVYSCGGSMHDYHGVGKATGEMLPMIAVPTTSGTGSEAQSFALISDAKTHVKMACGDPRAACKIALLDPRLTVTQPARVTTLTGIDALSHAIETYVTTRRNPMSLTFSRRAFGLLMTGFPRVLSDPGDLEARGQMQLGACLAGLAIETSMLGAAHATANPLTARFGISHGQAVGLMLPAVIRMNGVQHANWYAELLREVEPIASFEDAPDRLAERIRGLLRQAGLAVSLAALQVPEQAIPALSQEALQQWTGHFNPIPLDLERAESLYTAVR
jgi:alcohol dehydrogenase